MSHATGPLVIVVDDDQVTRFQLRLAMEQDGYDVVEAANGEECLRLCEQLHPLVILLDARMPVMDGFTCCAKLQALPGTHRPPILMITGLEDAESVDRAFAVGAIDYVTKPIHWAVLRQRVRRLIQQFQLQQQQTLLYQQLEAANQALQHLAAIDGLTQLANRRRFDEYLEQEWRRMAREQLPLSLIMGDVDFFKPYNDTYGHQSGDDCLCQIAKTLQSAVRRPADLVARYGGEEIAVILPNTTAIGAVHLATQILSDIRALRLTHACSPIASHVTLSLGVACCVPTLNDSATLLITAADKALYQAKAQGRNRATLAS